MKYLLDANVWLEAITAGAHSLDCRTLIQRAPAASLATTDFSIHSIALILTPTNPAEFRTFLDDLIGLKVFTLHLTPSDLYAVLDRMGAHRLDFDDAFQYFAAERNDLRIISYDSDFDRTPRGRLTPAQVMAEWNEQEKR